MHVGAEGNTGIFYFLNSNVYSLQLQSASGPCTPSNAQDLHLDERLDLLAKDDR